MKSLDKAQSVASAIPVAELALETVMYRWCTVTSLQFDDNSMSVRGSSAEQADLRVAVATA